MALGKKVKHKTKKLIDSKHMLKGITLASFLESTIVPIPLEAVMVPLMQARRESLWKIAFMATLGCVIGAVFGLPTFTHDERLSTAEVREYLFEMGGYKKIKDSDFDAYAAELILKSYFESGASTQD